MAMATTFLGVLVSVMVDAQLAATKTKGAKSSTLSLVLRGSLCGRLVELAAIRHYVSGLCICPGNAPVAKYQCLEGIGIGGSAGLVAGMLVPCALSSLDHRCG